jgi:2-phosphoglycolate phosphatase
MEIFKNSIGAQKPFVTKDGSVIRSIMDASNADVKNESLAEASLAPGLQTLKHIHKKSEEIYYFTQGSGSMLLGDEKIIVKAGDAVLIPQGTPHKIFNTGKKTIRLLCACAPAYSHYDTFTLENRYRLAIFDFDGTLVDSVTGIWKTADDMASQFGMKGFERGEIVASIGTGLDSFVNDLFPRQVKELGMEKVLKIYRKSYDVNYIEGLKVFKNVKKTLALLYAKGMTLAIVSNKLKKYVDNICKEAGIFDYFDVTLGSEDVIRMKPDPYAVYHLMKKYRVKKREIIFVGDSQYDVETAKNAGVDCVYLTYGYADKNVLKKFKPAFVFDDFGKIRDIV